MLSAQVTWILFELTATPFPKMNTNRGKLLWRHWEFRIQTSWITWNHGPLFRMRLKNREEKKIFWKFVWNCPECMQLLLMRKGKCWQLSIFPNWFWLIYCSIHDNYKCESLIWINQFSQKFLSNSIISIVKAEKKKMAHTLTLDHSFNR